MAARSDSHDDDGGFRAGSALTPDRLQQALTTLAAAVTVTDDEGRVIYANRAAAHLTGFERAEDMLSTAPGEVTSYYAMLDAERALVPGEALPSRRVASGEAGVAEQLLRVVDRRSGAQRWWVLRSTPLTEAGRKRLAVTVIEDVTAAKAAELRQAFLARAGEVLVSSLDYSRPSPGSPDSRCRRSPTGAAWTSSTSADCASGWGVPPRSREAAARA